MAIYKRGGTYWYAFVFKGRQIQESTRQKSARTARDLEAARRTQLARGEVGIEDVQPVPTLNEFAPKFKAHIEIRCAEKPATVDFYFKKLARLLEFSTLRNAKLDKIDEALIERYIEKRRANKLSPATVNRELATLRRLLYLAKRWSVIKAVPTIEMLDGERQRKFVLSHSDENNYLAIAPDPLRDVAQLILDTGLRIGEAVGLRWVDVHLEPLGSARFGYLQVRGGKTKNAKRTVSLTARASEILASKLANTMSLLVFPSARKLDKPCSTSQIQHQHQKVRDALGLDVEFVIHSLRHTMLTRLGHVGVDAFTIKRIAGHSSITVSERYVHPSDELMERAVERLEILNKNEVNRPDVSTILATPQLEQPAEFQLSIAS